MNNMEKYLPLGTVVLLKNGKKRVMVTGFAATAPETNGKMFDYMGCLYPEGVISSDKNLLFDHEQIDKIFYMGYIDDEWKQVEKKIKEVVAVKLSLPEEKEEDVYVPKTEPQVEEEGQTVEGTTKSENIFKVNTDLFN